MFKIREFDEIKAQLEQRSGLRAAAVKESFGEDYLRLCLHLADHEIAADHIFFSYEKAKQENIDYRKEFEKLNESMWIFAGTGQGDLWLLDLNVNDGEQVYFYDHDVGDYSGENLLKMCLDIKKWFVLADLLSQLEALFDHTESHIYFDQQWKLKPQYKQQLASEMESIKEGLADVYPFDF
jgi:hypothetical protein